MTQSKSKVPKVAVITRTKDRTVLLERAIQSVHSQTMRDFVHVIINDAGEIQAVERLIEKYKNLTEDRVVVIHNKVSGGMEAATNKAIRFVSSSYIAIHDDDDTWHPEFLERTTALLEEGQAMGVVTRADKIIETIEESSGTVRSVRTKQWMPDLRAVNLYRQFIDNQMTPITFMYHRSVIDEIGYYDETLPVLGDWDFGIRFLLKYDIEYLDPGFALANYHHRKYKAGSSANNSFGSGTDKHRYYANKIMNKHLRQELADGQLGAGYIMSKLKYNESQLARIGRLFMPQKIVEKAKKRFGN